MRQNGRGISSLRTVRITRNYIRHAEGSVLIELGDTKVICNASIENKVPPFLKDKKKGWITAEYSMLPRSANARMQRESSRGRVGGRTHEIQRLIGRALRSVVDLEAIGERTIWLDCDVIQADGGTRTASITGAFVALYDAIKYLKKKKMIDCFPIEDFIAATSVGIIDGKHMLDLDYSEDSNAQVDMNIVMTGKGKFVEIQGTAEGSPFSGNDMNKLLVLSKKGIKELIKVQKRVLKI